MRHGYSLLFFSYFALLLFAWMVARYRFSPAVAFLGTWCCSMGLLAVGSLTLAFGPEPLSAETLKFLLMAGVCVTIGAVVAHLVPTLRRPSRAIDMGNDTTREQAFRLPSIRVLAGVALVCSVIHVFRAVPSLSVFLASAGSIRDQLTDPAQLASNKLATVATYAAMIVMPVLGAYWVRHKRITWWMIATLGAVTLLAVSAVGKFMFIFVGLTFINIVLYSRRRGRSVRLAPILAAAGGIVGVFIIVEELRSRRESIDEPRQSQGLASTLFVYATGYVPAFSSFYEEYRAGDVTTFPVNEDFDPRSKRFGNQTFSGIYRALASVGLVGRSASNRYEGSFNVYSLHRDLIMDFGVSGSLVALFFLGFISTSVYRHCDLGTARHLVFVSLLTTQMEFSLVYSLFGFMFYPVMLVCSPFLSRKMPPQPRGAS